MLTQDLAVQRWPMGFLCESLPRGKSTGRYRQGFLSSLREQ